jgi:hypothetical protein
MRLRSILLSACFACSQEVSREALRSNEALSPVPTTQTQPVVGAALSAPTVYAKTHTAMSPRGFVSEEVSSTIYIMSADSDFQIKAIDAKTGDKRWTSTAAEKPLWVKGDQLIAEKGDGRLALLDTTNGKPISSCELDQSLMLPLIQPRVCSTSKVIASEHGGKVYLAWSVEVPPISGVVQQPTKESMERYERLTERDSGLIIVEPETCKAYKSTDPIPTEGSSTPLVRRLVGKDKKAQILVKGPSGKEFALAMEEPMSYNPYIEEQNERYVMVGYGSPGPYYERLLFSLPDGTLQGHVKGYGPVLVGDPSDPNAFIVTDTGVAVTAVDLHTEKQLWKNTEPLRQFSRRECMVP